MSHNHIKSKTLHSNITSLVLLAQLVQTQKTK